MEILRQLVIIVFPLRQPSSLVFVLLLSMPFWPSSSFLLRRSCGRRRFIRHYSTSSSNKMTGRWITDQSPPIVVIIAGPTAAGKSDVAKTICAEQKGMVLSADSVQAYRGVQIGANKPSMEERRETPHILIDVADHLDSYNTAEWREDAIACIQNMIGRHQEQQQQEDIATTPVGIPRRAKILESIQQASIEKGYCDGDDGLQQTILPVVCGGTMMYLQWLVHGRPDAMRPTSSAVDLSYKTIRKFQNDKNNYEGAVKFVSSFGDIFANRSQQISVGDWYRLRRTLEIALTVKEKEKSNERNGRSESGVDNLVEQLYTNQRQGSLSSLGYDVRCFFLCPDERMSHTKIIDKRCEQIIIKGLLKETTDLSLSGHLPEMAERAIGYRQTLDYLHGNKQDHTITSTNTTEEDAFEHYLKEFTTATRRYAKKQMAWFRKDKDFMFIPVSLNLEKSVRINAAANDISRLCLLSRKDYEKELFGIDSTSEKTKRENEAQGKTMKFYKPERHILKLDTTEYADALAEGIECRRNVLYTDKKRKREQTVE